MCFIKRALLWLTKFCGCARKALTATASVEVSGNLGKGGKITSQSGDVDGELVRLFRSHPLSVRSLQLSQNWRAGAGYRPHGA